MEIAITVLLILGIIAMMFTVYIGIRNNMVYDIRTWFLWGYWDKHGEYYGNLGSYDFMLYNPAVQHLWTKKQWLNYVIKKSNKE